MWPIKDPHLFRAPLSFVNFPFFSRFCATILSKCTLLRQPGRLCSPTSARQYAISSVLFSAIQVCILSSSSHFLIPKGPLHIRNHCKRIHWPVQRHVSGLAGCEQRFYCRQRDDSEGASGDTSELQGGNCERFGCDVYRRR